jgi:TolB-like protein/AraC-like DNA-binding protein
MENPGTTIVNDLADKKFLEKLIKVTEAHLANEAFNVMELAREMRMNRTSLYRKIKTLTKKSISQFIREQRLKRSMEMLRDNSHTISEIAYEVGFASVNYFDKCFHDFYGFPPGEARTRIREVTGNANESGTVESDGFFKQSNGSTSVDHKHKIPGLRYLVIATFGIVIIVLLITLMWNSSTLPFNPFSGSCLKSAEKSIAILPFVNDTPDSSNVYFNNGIAEAIRDRLTSIRDLKVISRNTTERYRNNITKPTKQLARELRARYFVEGSSQKSGNDVWITVQLIDGRKDKHLFSRQYPGKYEDVFSLWGEIALDVANEIRAVITPEEKKLMKEPLSENPEALRLIITGQDLLSRTAENTNQKLEFRKQAEASYRKAILLDSTNSDALAGLARICIDKQNTDSALILADKAIHYNVRNANAYLLKCDVYNDSRMPSETEKNLKLALKYDPKHIRAHHLLGGLYYSRGEFLKAFQCLFKSIELTGNLAPASSRYELILTEWNTLYLARCLFGLGFYEEGKKFSLQWFKLSNDVPWGYNYNIFAGGIINCKFEEVHKLGLSIPEKDLCLYYMGMNFLFLGKYKEALENFLKIQETERLNGRYFHRIHHLKAFSFFKTGDKINADKYFKLAEFYVDTLLSAHPGYKKTENVYAIMDRYWRNPLFILTTIAAVRDEKEKALGYLRELRINFPASDLQVVTFLKFFPMFDNIRNEPEFQDYLHEAENHYLSERSKVEILLKKEGIIK